MSDELIRYQHAKAKADEAVVWFVQLAKDPVPEWAVKVEPYVEPVYTEEDWLTEMAEHSGVGYYDENGNWQWTDED